MRERKAVWRVAWGIAVVLVVWGSLTPADFRLLQVRWSDKIMHAGAYLVLAVLGGLSLSGRNGRLWAALGMVLLGWCVEGLQSLVPGHDCSAADGVANMIGSGLGLLIATGLATCGWRDTPPASMVGKADAQFKPS